MCPARFLALSHRKATLQATCPAPSPSGPLSPTRTLAQMPFGTCCWEWGLFPILSFPNTRHPQHCLVEANPPGPIVGSLSWGVVGGERWRGEWG